LDIYSQAAIQRSGSGGHDTGHFGPRRKDPPALQMKLNGLSGLDEIRYNLAEVRFQIHRELDIFLV
jgi:hypothetical protein